MTLVNRLGLLAGLVALSALGCAQSASTVRGQNVDYNDGPIIGSAPGYGELKKNPKAKQDFRPLAKTWDNRLGDEWGTYSTKEDYYANHRKVVYDVDHGGGGMGCPACNGGMNCPDGGCPHCGCGCRWGHKPKNYHTYQYNWPQNLVYPSPQLPAGMVQYPYYTLRGPTDFFMK